MSYGSAGRRREWVVRPERSTCVDSRCRVRAVYRRRRLCRCFLVPRDRFPEFCAIVALRRAHQRSPACRLYAFGVSREGGRSTASNCRARKRASTCTTRSIVDSPARPAPTGTGSIPTAEHGPNLHSDERRTRATLSSSETLRPDGRLHHLAPRGRRGRHCLIIANCEADCLCCSSTT